MTIELLLTVIGGGLLVAYFIGVFLWDDHEMDD